MGAAIAGLTVASQSAQAQSSKGSSYEPARHEQDAWFADNTATHRVFIDSSTPLGGSDAPRYAFNIMNSHINAYGGSNDDYAMIVCFRHASTAFGYGDALWEKYGEIFARRMAGYVDPETNEAPRRNMLNVGGGPFSGATLDALTGRGVRFAVCATATRGLAGMVAGATGQDTDAVFSELEQGLVDNARLVPAGVMAATRSQEYGYSLLYAG